MTNINVEFSDEEINKLRRRKSELVGKLKRSLDWKEFILEKCLKI